MLRVILSLLGLIVVSAVHAGPPGPGADLQPPPTSLAVEAPVVDRAESAPSDPASFAGPGSSPSSPPDTSSAGPSPPFRASEPHCQALENAAAAYDLPLEFFVRLIRQESNFNPYSVSHKGAQGIAQFMPGTARWRGLADPFEPLQALHESARWLRELREQFGNLGLAAAAYNAGPRRVQDWLAGRGPLPGETRAYVRIITGRDAEEWTRGPVADQVHWQKGVPCGELAGRLLQAPRNPAPVQIRNALGEEVKTEAGPWGLQLIGNWSQAKALSDYKVLQRKFASVLGDRAPMIIKSRMLGHGSAPWYLIRVAESTRDRAKQLCSRLESAGGSCLVYRN